MLQKRIFVTAPEAEARAMFDALDSIFEDDGYAITIFETQEDSGIFQVSVYVPDNGDEVDQATARIKPVAGVAYAVEVEELPDIDWVSKTLEDLQPVRAGRFIIHGSHHRDRLTPADFNIEIEAGQAFGTGHHGTTSGCLIMMDKLIARRKPFSVLDLGTGSAVLAIAAAKLAHDRVLATDIDPIATAVAKDNAKLNHVANHIRFETAGGFSHACFREEGPFDLIIANILAKPLMKMAPDIERHLSLDGDVVLSGILAEQRWKVLAAFRQAGLIHRETIWREGWVTLHLARHA